ncbi:hypothetical protein LWC34_28770 [Kibdelosporangium philippinense]|uniref:Uncharacterized protein n=1 Tax=Kibdelosporangium philippinense TaxID=211113 RepID=A0ABS8ZIM3_9PSEU|nr:hypothetical protein [Kibdelosporangium philippinense]MCE7006790.1 hypothetical protein [Kibdelosporangium philippinense]
MAATALAALRTSEQAQVLTNLLRSHPELSAEAEWHATTLLSAPSHEEVSATLADTLTAYEFADMDAPDVTVCDPDDACAYLVDKAVEPYLAEIQRRAALGLINAAHGIATGVLMSLYGLREYEHCTEHVLGSAGDLVDYARRVTILLEQLEIPLPERNLAMACPTWPLAAG